MSVIRPFKAVRPLPEYAGEVAALPYDVMNSQEAAEMVVGKPHSFLHVDRAEIDLPEGTDMYSDEVYQKAKSNLEALVTDGICKKDEKPMYYIYRQLMGGRAQTGLVACASVDDYVENKIKRHELTRADKEVDRLKHVSICNANTGPIFLTHRPDDELKFVMREWMMSHDAVYDFLSDDGVGSKVWAVDDDETINKITEIMGGIDSLYIADGHHRCASAVSVGLQRRKENPDYDGTEEFNYFLAVIFSCDDLQIMAYNRVIKDLNGMTVEKLLERISEKFEVKKIGAELYSPKARHSFGMLVDGVWYCLTAKEGTYDDNDPVNSLDVSILQNNLIGPVLGITDPRTDKRIDFVGGIRGLGELDRRVKTDMRLAFSMYPTSIEELMKIADIGKIMPPKSTWFEPKLLSGLFIHELD